MGCAGCVIVARDNLKMKQQRGCGAAAVTGGKTVANATPTTESARLMENNVGQFMVLTKGGGGGILNVWCMYGHKSTACTELLYVSSFLD